VWELWAAAEAFKERNGNMKSGTGANAKRDDADHTTRMSD
jgi:hypothetical protein